MPQSKLTAERPSPMTGEQRRFRRVQVSILGRYMLEDKREFPCQTIDISPGGLALAAPVAPRLGERIVVYLEDLGRVEGVVARLLPSGFAISFESTQKKRERLATQLSWLINRQDVGLRDNRRNQRITPNKLRTTVTRQDGTQVPAFLIDISRSGAAALCEAQFEFGDVVTIGKSKAHVVRIFETGIAVEFARPIPVELFDEDYEV